MVRARSSGSSRVSRVTKTGKPGGQPRGKDLSLNSVPTAATQVPPPPPEAEGVITTGDASFLARPDMPDHQKPAESRSTPPPPPSVPLHHRHTNATLLTPRGSRISACQPCSPPPAGIVSAPGILEKQVTSSPTTAVPAPVTAAAPGMLLEQGVAHLLAKAPQLKPVIEQHPCRLFAPDSLAAAVDPFDSLVSGVLGQQVSGAAARSIRDRFVALFPVNEAVKGNHGSGSRLTRPFPTPEQVAVADLAVLRTAGLSQRKAEYITGLAAKFVSGELNARKLLEDSDEELMEQLLAVRGLGRWSVEMFACFALKRTDIFSTGDLGVQCVAVSLLFTFCLAYISRLTSSSGVVWLPSWAKTWKN